MRHAWGRIFLLRPWQKSLLKHGVLPTNPLQATTFHTWKFAWEKKCAIHEESILRYLQISKLWITIFERYYSWIACSLYLSTSHMINTIKVFLTPSFISVSCFWHGYSSSVFLHRLQSHLTLHHPSRRRSFKASCCWFFFYFYYSIRIMTQKVEEYKVSWDGHS